MDYSDATNLLTPIKAIRAKCLDCSGNQPSEVRQCSITSCALWPYRMGHRPTYDEVQEASTPNA